MSIEQKYLSSCLQQKFNLPTYQRDYKWGATHLQDLIGDIQNTFMTQWKKEHGRESILDYKDYFLGSIIVAPGENGGKVIIDGQQRITTLTLLLCYFHRYSLLNPHLDISPVDANVRRKLAGKNSFNLDVTGSREELFNVLMSDETDDIVFCSSIDSIVDKDAGTIKIWNQYQRIDELIDSDIINNNLIPHFIDYLTERVYLYQILVNDESDGHKVFVTMNDRGLKLTPIDLLKGFLLSGITVTHQNSQAHEAWQSVVNELNKLGNDEASVFIKNWLRAKHATSNRAKRVDEEPKDFDVISSNYHRWVIDNKAKLKLNNNDEFFRFVDEEIRFFSRVYTEIRNLEMNLDTSSPFVYYNSSRDLTVQAMVIMSAIRNDDNQEIISEKIKLVSYYLDMVATIRYLKSKPNTYDSLRDISYKMVMDFRNKKLDELKGIIFSKINLIQNNIENVKLLRYEKTNRKLDLLRFLSRIADYLESGMSLTNAVGYTTYVNRQLDHKTFDIEHLLADKYNEVNAYLSGNSKTIFSTKEEFFKVRNSIGGLILLPRGRNRSFRDVMYGDKVGPYATENVLAQTLTEDFYKNQPNYVRFSSASKISLSSYKIIDKDSIKERSEVYEALARKLWSLDRASEIFGPVKNTTLQVVDDTE